MTWISRNLMWFSCKMPTTFFRECSSTNHTEMTQSEHLNSITFEMIWKRLFLYYNFCFISFRTELNDKGAWTALQYADNFEPFWDFQDNVERIIEDDVTCDEFIERYEKIYKPVIILGCQKQWKANEKWTMARLAKKYRNQKFKCGEDNEGYSVKMKMKYYVDYMRTTKDDSPLYIFDSGFGEVRVFLFSCHWISQNFNVPFCVFAASSPQEAVRRLHNTKVFPRRFI